MERRAARVKVAHLFFSVILSEASLRAESKNRRAAIRFQGALRDRKTGTGFAGAKLSEVLRLVRDAHSLRMTNREPWRGMRPLARDARCVQEFLGGSETEDLPAAMRVFLVISSPHPRRDIDNPKKGRWKTLQAKNSLIEVKKTRSASLRVKPDGKNCNSCAARSVSRCLPISPRANRYVLSFSISRYA